MNRIFRNELVFKRMPTMEMRRTVLDDSSTARIPSGYRRLHSIPEYYPKQQQIQKMFNDYYNVPSLGKPAYRRNTQDNVDDMNRLQQMKFRAENEAQGAVQYINTKRRDDDFTSEDFQRRLREMPNNEEIARAIQVFENKLSLLNLSNERKKQVRDEFYNSIFQADKEIIFNIAKDETGQDIKEILKLVRQANIGGENAEMGAKPVPVKQGDIKEEDEEYAQSLIFPVTLEFTEIMDTNAKIQEAESYIYDLTILNENKAVERKLSMPELRKVIILASQSKKLKNKKDDISKMAQALKNADEFNLENIKDYLKFIRENRNNGNL
jgi:hypothetical protein